MHQMVMYLKTLRLPNIIFSHFAAQETKIEKDSMLFWRMRIFSTIFFITAFIGIFPLISNINIALDSGRVSNAIIYTLCYILVIIVTFAKKVPFRVRVWTGLFIFFAIGFISTMTLGLAGSGRLYFFAFSVLASLLLGLKAGVLALALNICSFFFLGLLLNTGYLEFSLPRLYTADKWVAAGLSFTVLDAAITISAGLLVAALESIIGSEQGLTRELKLSNLRLEKKYAEHQQAKESLKMSEEKYKTLTNNLHVGIYRNTTGSHGRFIEANPAIVEMFGFDNREEFLSVNVSDLYQNPDDRNNYNEKMLNDGSVNKYEVKLKKKDGNFFDGSVSAVAVKDASGQVKYYDGIIEDITGKRELELQLQQAQKMEAIGTLAGGIAHDFNNILSAIIGYTELSLDDIEKKPSLYQNLQEIFRASGRAKDLVKQILTFSRQAKQEIKPVQVKLIIKEAIKFLRASLPSTIEIRQKVESESLVMADPTQIHQLLMNLCTNAGHAMREEGGILEIKLSDVTLENELTTEHSELKPGSYLELIISDTGYGMSENLLERIFDPFFTTKEKSEGTGMGLSVVHGIVGSYGGKIIVNSQLGKGSTFKIYLPSVKREMIPTLIPDKSIPIGNERILFIDDEPALIKIGKKMLESLGYKVTGRTSSIEALELFKSKADSFDLVITDMTMPHMSGDELAKEMININPEIPIILCTGYSTQINQQQALSMGIRAFVSKPVLKLDIAETIRKIFDE